MAQGLQVFDENGVLVVDTSSAILKELVSQTVVATNTTTNSIGISVPSNTTAVPNVSKIENEGDLDNRPEVEISGTDLNYKFYNSSGASSTVTVLLF